MSILLAVIQDYVFLQEPNTYCTDESQEKLPNDMKV